MTGTMTWVGLDVHARSTHAVAVDVMTGELSRVRFGPGVEAPVGWLESLPAPVWACYEAGPIGYGLYRVAVAAGIRIDVVAPGKTPRGPSDRVKSDRRDAELLARCLLAGSLKPVTVPPARVEAARELTRAHDACRRDLMNARHRVSKMLLRHGRVYPKVNTWSQEHGRWLAGQQFEQEMSAFVFADLVARVDGLSARKAVLAERISRLATDPEFWPTVARLRAFRGVDTLTALSLHLELGADWQRFEKPTRLGSWLARRLLVESAWHYGRDPRIGATLQNRQQGQPEHVLQIANTAQQRIHRVYHRMKARGKPHHVIVVACARELACFLWAAATAP
jgi:transposase